MARERFEDGSSQADGATYTLDNPSSYGGNLGKTIHHKDDSTGTWWDEKQSTPDREDVNRFRGIGDAMQNRPDYQFDWSQADESRRNGINSGAYQDDASNAWKQQALGQDRTSYNYGQSLLDRGAQNQQAAALSTSGGPLAQVGAAARAQNARSAFMQKGTNDLNAQQADDQAAGRAGWAKGLGETRKMDETGQSLSDQQAEMAAQAAAQQRRLNDAGQYGMEQNAVRVEGDAVNSTQHQLAAVDKMRNAKDAANDASDARAMGVVSAGIGAIPYAGKAMAAGGEGAAAANKDPNSDERVKDKLDTSELIASTPGYDRSIYRKNDDGTTPNKAVMTSDERAKEEAQDDEETRRFMEGSKPVAPLSKEDRDKEEYELRERAHEEEKKRADAVRQNKIDWANNDDNRTQNVAAPLKKIPLLNRLAQPRASETDDQKVARAEASHKTEQGIVSTKKKVDDWASSFLPESVRGGLSRAPVAMGYRPEHDSRQKGSIRQPVSFEYGDKDDKSKEATSDERAKSKVDYANPKEIKPLGNDAGTERHWDSDISTENQAKASGGASLSGPAPKYSSSSPKPAPTKPSAPKTRKYTDDELRKMGEEMQGNVRVQSETQLGEGPSVGKAKWLDDYMTSDEGAKSSSGNPLIEMQKGANRALRGETYRYKEGVGEDTEQLHHGFMAQNLEGNPITATAVREGDDGLKKVNNEDALRVTAAGVASLQDQHDELEAAVDALASRRKKKVA